MNVAKTKRTANALVQLVRLYELRLTKAQFAHKQQQRLLKTLKTKYDARRSDHEAVLEQKASLELVANSEQYLSNVQAQQDIQIKNNWLIYDEEKAACIFKIASSELAEQQKVAQIGQAKLMQLRRKCQQYQEQLDVALAGFNNVRMLQQELDQEEDVSARLAGGQAHA